jgi:hypothetical protein
VRARAPRPRGAPDLGDKEEGDRGRSGEEERARSRAGERRRRIALVAGAKVRVGSSVRAADERRSGMTRPHLNRCAAVRAPFGELPGGRPRDRDRDGEREASAKDPARAHPRQLSPVRWSAPGLLVEVGEELRVRGEVVVQD